MLSSAAPLALAAPALLLPAARLAAAHCTSRRTWASQAQAWSRGTAAEEVKGAAAEEAFYDTTVERVSWLREGCGVACHRRRARKSCAAATTGTRTRC